VTKSMEVLNIERR